MENSIINVIIDSGICEKNGLYNVAKSLEYTQEISDHLIELIGKDKFLEFEPILTNYEAHLEENALIAGFKLGVNLMNECRI